MKRKLVDFYGGPLDGDSIPQAAYKKNSTFTACFADGVRLQFDAIYRLKERDGRLAFFHEGYLDARQDSNRQ